MKTSEPAIHRGDGPVQAAFEGTIMNFPPRGQVVWFDRSQNGHCTFASSSGTSGCFRGDVSFTENVFLH